MNISISALAAAAALVLLGSAAHAQIPFTVSYESEAPGVETTTASFGVSGVETFSNAAPGYGDNFTTDFGTGGQIVGTYNGVQVNNADQ